MGSASARLLANSVWLFTHIFNLFNHFTDQQFHGPICFRQNGRLQNIPDGSQVGKMSELNFR